MELIEFGKQIIIYYLGNMNYALYISIDPNIRFGKPCIKNTRITVYDVLGWLASGMRIEEILEDYPELTVEGIRACLGFAADKEHKLKIAS
jgi:uncharacterized protein (DUF433 family)